MTLILVAPGGGRPNVVAAAMTAAASTRGAQVNLGALQSQEADPVKFAQHMGQLLNGLDLSIMFLEPAASDPQFIYRICEAVEDADIDLVLHVACARDTDAAVEMVDGLRGLQIEPSGLVLDAAPTDEQKLSESRQFLAAAAGVPVVGAIPEGAERLEPQEFARQSVTWFDEDEG